MSKQAHRTHSIIKGAALAALISLAPALAQAAPAQEELEALRAEIRSLEARLAALEAQAAADAATPQQPAVVATPPPAPAPAADKPAGPKVAVDWKGLTVSSADKSYSVRIRPRIQFDAHFFPDAADGPSEFYVRRVRPVIQGVAGPASWRFMPELSGDVRVLDAWIDLNLGEDTYVRAGKFKGVIGLERLQSFSKNLFVERGLPSQLTPTREIGLELHQDLLDDTVELTLGIYNGVLDDTDNSSNKNLSGGDFDYGARVYVKPWTNDEGSALKGLGFGIGASFGDESTTIDGTADRRLRYRTGGLQTFFQLNNGVALDGRRVRINPHVNYYNGPFGFLAEYVSSSYELSRGGVARDATNWAWTVQASWVLTGEDASFDGVRPANSFSPAKGDWGAFEIAARHSRLRADDALFGGSADVRLASSTSVQEASVIGLGLNWFFNDNLLWQIDYENTDFSGLGPDRSSEDALITRFQIDY